MKKQIISIAKNPSTIYEVNAIPMEEIVSAFGSYLTLEIGNPFLDLSPFVPEVLSKIYEVHVPIYVANKIMSPVARFFISRGIRVVDYPCAKCYSYEEGLGLFVQEWEVGREGVVLYIDPEHYTSGYVEKYNTRDTTIIGIDLLSINLKMFKSVQIPGCICGRIPKKSDGIIEDNGVIKYFAPEKKSCLIENPFKSKCPVLE